MADKTLLVGRVLRASSREFAVGCKVMRPDIPAFGAFVRSDGPTPGSGLFGLIYDVAVRDDLLARRVVVADPPEEVVKDQQENRLLPIEVSVLSVGWEENGRIIQRIPPQPPVALDTLYLCQPQQEVDFTRRLDYFRLVLSAPQVPADDLLVASLHTAAAARPEDKRAGFLVEAGRELARLLGGDLLRLDGLLRQLSSR